MSRSIQCILDKSSLLCATIFYKLSIFHNSEMTDMSVCPSLLAAQTMFYFSVSGCCNKCERVFLKIPSQPRGADTLEIEIVTVRAH